MYNTQSSNEELDRTKLFFFVPSGMNQDVMTRLFQDYGLKEIFRSHPPKNFAFASFDNEGDAQRAMLDVGNRPPFNLTFSYARFKSQTPYYKKTYKDSGRHYSGSKFGIKNKNGLNKSKASECSSDHSSSYRGSLPGISQAKRSNPPINSFAGPSKYALGKNNAVVKSSIKKQPQNAVNILVDKTLDLIKTDNMFKDVKVHEWFGRAMKDFINLYMDNVKNPSENIQSIHKEFAALTEEDFASCNESGGEEVTIPRASVAESLGVGEKMKLSIVSAKRMDKAFVCVTVSDRVQQQYESLCNEFSSICEKQDSAAAEKGNRGGLMAVKLASDGMWYRAVMQDQDWALLDDGRVVTSDDVLRSIPCPQPYFDIPIFCCLLTHDIKILNEDIPFTVKVLSKDRENRIMEVTVCNAEYGLQFKAILKPWIPSVTVISSSTERQGIQPQKKVESKQNNYSNSKKNTVTAVSKTVATPSEIVPRIPKIRKFVAEVCNEGDELKLSVISTKEKELVCLTLGYNFSTQYKSLCDEFAGVCAIQKPASTGKGSEEELMAVRLASDSMWYRAVFHGRGWALPDDGRVVTFGEVQRVVLCPQPYADIPFFCCLLVHDHKSIDDSVPYTVKILKKDEATRSLNVKVSNNNVGASFDGRLHPWPFTAGNHLQTLTNGSSNQELAPKRGILPVKHPKFRMYTPENCKEGEELNLSVISAEGKSLLCLTLSESTTSQYESLCDEFVRVCEKQKPVPAGKESKGVLMAVKLVRDHYWYRAISFDQYWVLPDDGHAITPGNVQGAVICPQPYADIPFFCCLLIHNEKTVDVEAAYKVKIVRKDEATRSLDVKVLNVETRITFDGRLQSWLPTDEKNVSPQITCLKTVRTSEKPKFSNIESPAVSSKPAEKKSPSANNLNKMKSPGGDISKDTSFPEKEHKKTTTENTVTEIRKCMAEMCSIGEVMNLSLISTDEKGAGEICLTVSERTRQEYQSLCDQFAHICGKEPMPAEKDNEGLMAVRLSSDCMWYRAVSHDRGWALLDDGRTVTSDEVMRVLPCPQPYADIPFFCCLLDTKDINNGLCYKFKVLSKEETNRTILVNLSNVQHNISTQGTLKPWIPCITTTRNTSTRMSGRLSAVGMAPSEPPSASDAPVMCGEIPKLAINSGSLVTLVKFVNFNNVFLRLADEENSRKYLLHLDSLAVYGFKAPPLGRTPLPGEVVLCNHNDDQYYRATVVKCDTTEQMCDVEFLDLCLTWTVDIKGLRPCPSWVGQVSPPLSVALTQLKSYRYNNASLMYIKGLKQKKAILKCKEYSESGVHLIVQQTMQDVNKTLLELSTPMWKKLQQQDKSILSLPILTENDVIYQPMSKGHPVRITDTGMIIIGAVSCVLYNEKLKNQLADLTEQINDYCNSTPDPYLPRQNEVCLHKHEDGNWHRAYVVEINKDLVDVRSLDYGKMIYHIHFSLIRKMIFEFMEPLPALATLCTLNDFPKEPTEKLVARSQEILEANPIVTPTILEKDAPGVYKIIIPDLSTILKREGLL